MVAKRQVTQGTMVACVDGGGALWTAESKFKKRSKKQGVRGRRLIAAVALGAMMVPGATMLGSAPDAMAADKGVAGAMTKMDQSLIAVHEQQQSGPAARSLRVEDASPLSAVSLARVVDGKVLIDAAASGQTDELLADLEALGLERGSAFGRMVSGWLPVDALEQAAELGSLQLARASASLSRAGSVTSEGDPSMLSDIARLFFGTKGRRITVGTLSDSYDCLGGAAGDIATGDLPLARRITILDDSACPVDPDDPPRSDEGRAMMQLVRDVAPRASQAFHTAFGGQCDFANGIVELANQAGSEVIVDDVIYFAEPMFQDGIIAQAVDQVKSQGVAYFSSAGNGGRNSWDSGNDGFVNSGIPGVFGGLRHDFNPGDGVDDLQSAVLGTGTTFFAFQWDEPFFSVSGVPGSASDMDIILYLPGGIFIGLGGFSFNIGGDAVEVFGVTNIGPPLPVEIGLELFAGPAPRFMKYVIFDPSSDSIDDPPTSFPAEYQTNSSTNYGHSNAAGAAGVGAAFWRRTPRFGDFPPRINVFSSAGGTPILFDTDGLPVDELRAQPRFTGPDGGITTFFGNRDDFGNRDPDGTNFFGTSAAAPHVAAVAALMLEADRSLTPDEVYKILEDTAIDMDDPATPGFDFGFDFGTGNGFVNALAAVRKAHGEEDDDDDDDDYFAALDQ